MPKGDKAILKADPEDGTTPIANLLLEGLIISDLTSKERAAMLFLIRRTYGWSNNGNRLKEDVIPLTTWAKVLQVKDIGRASKILTSLERKNLIHRQLLGAGKSYTYTVNTTLANWNNCINLQLLSEMTTLVLPKRTRVVLSQSTIVPDTNLAMPKESIKENIKKDIYTDIDRELHKQGRPGIDPERFRKGQYGHAVARTRADIEERKKLRAELNANRRQL
jgi:phage replication O-like protein O